ncbi:phosphatidylinositol-glycan biosynthesis class X protein-like [Haliotis rubra]|uniref:phosphatidylinositol-glycan biosynthesis class X protein-like n=1 Tax=Haliotis rubra TaxID=36100 RepID=UPI001EE53CB5|nr:phosphatidylinositol-glycan biosynthesis class X protein-like [Haliotis rubra]XP_046571343.1 phosphatidylinositol-glycan biosynthesis class X protein-like [Haliotis rubra]
MCCITPAVLTVLASSVLCLTSASRRIGTPYLERHLHKKGFHRDLSTTVEWLVNPHNRGDINHCMILLLEKLPPGVYVDPFQLSAMLQFGGPKVLVDAAVNIEKPAHLSPPHTLHVYTELKTVTDNDEGFSLAASVTLPIHLRYQPPTHETSVTHVDLVISNPRMFTNCSIKESVALLQAPCDYTNTSQCLWHEHHYLAEQDSVACRVPVGNTSYLPLVVAVTLLVTGLGCLFIVYVVMTKQPQTKLKTS